MTGQSDSFSSLSSTRFSDVFHTNYVPSKEETDEIRSIIRDPEEEIRRIDEEISRLQERRDKLQHFVARHRELLSPFRRLPGEIWGEVFVRCLPDRHLPRCRMSQAPLILTVICRSWRDIALRTPRLWNALHMTLPSPSVAFEGEDLVSLLKSRKEGLGLWLERSGTLPLDISLAMDIPIDAVGSKAENYVDCIGRIAECRTRWRSLSLVDIAPSAVHQADGLSPEDLPLLEAFNDIGHRNRRLFSHTRSQPTFFHTVGNSPSLRKLRTNIYSQADFDLPLRWRHLRVLEIQVDIGLPDCPSLVQKMAESCPLLVDCILLLNSPMNDQPQSNILVTRPRDWNHLRGLAITFHNYVDETSQLAVFNVFESITTPVLTHLSVTLFSYGDGLDRSSDLPFRNLITRSQCNLESLELQMPYGAGLQETLDDLTSLVTLSLSHAKLSFSYGDDDPTSLHLDPIVTTTLMASEGPVRCPNIERLILQGYHPLRASALADLIETRARFTKLKSLTVDFGVIRSQKTYESVTSALMSVESKQLGVTVEWRNKNTFVSSAERYYAHFPGADYDSFIL
ncbi:hypothetical protein PQX77_018185 [Marasmius sp. AFHP31]|nr:hypothetical protein PQX77_018185 [Marasmius sp. AFHP31]